LVREQLVLTRRLVESRLTVRYTAELTYEDPVPRLELDVLVARCRELLGLIMIVGNQNIKGRSSALQPVFLNFSLADAPCSQHF
jgi:hypothetical protein